MRRTAAVTLCALATAAPAAAATTTAPYAIDGVAVRLYYPQSGTLSPDIPASAQLFNTVIGEGWAREPSSSVLVQVVVRGEPGSFVAGRRVRLLVHRIGAGGRVLSLLDRQSAQVGLLAGPGPRAGSTRVGFLVQGTGCARIRVGATLLGQSPVAAAREVPFVCGE